MSTQENKALIQRFYDEFTNTGNLSAADELIAPECRLYFAGNLVPTTGPEAFKQMLTALRTAFPDIHWTPEDMIAEGNKVVERVSGHGTHLGEFQGIPPTGKQIKMKGIAIFRIENNKIVENWAMPDMLGLLQQLGAKITPP